MAESTETTETNETTPDKTDVASESSETLETTPVGGWIVPNQDKFEQVIDARLKQNADFEKANKKTSSRSSSKSS